MAISQPRSRSGVSGPTSPGIAALLGDLASFVDPVALARRVDIVPDPWQAEVLRSDADRILLNCSRQTGKSTVAGLLALRKALYVPNSTTLLVSPGQRQSQELYLKARAMYRRLGRPIAPEAENQMSLSLENGSRIISLPGNESTVRTYTADLLIVDEASRVRDDDYAAYSPMLAVSGGQMIALSTPRGVSGWWSEAWHDEYQAWARWEVPATMCPRITPEFLKEERLRLGEWRFKQEYLCQFLDDTWSVFSVEAIAGIANQTIAEVPL